MELKLHGMTIDNFKGVSHRTIEFGDVTEIKGKNGIGKSTIPDAFYWVLFNKDANGNASGSDKFREKPLDENGNERHNLVTSVELNCALDGQPFVLRKEQAENWVKKRGFSESVFQGNESKYFINGVELKQSEFKSRVALIANEDAFRMVAVLSAFNALPWQKRREMLMQLVDDDMDKRMLEKHEYADILTMCTERGISVDDARKVVSGTLKMQNKEMSTLPIRIDEANRSMQDESGWREGAVSEAEAEVAEIEKAIDKERASRLVNDVQSQIDELTRQMNGLFAQAESEYKMKCAEVKSLMDSANVNKRSWSEALDMADARLTSVKEELDAVTAKRDAKREEFKAEYGKRFTFENDGVCHYCGQALPEEKIAEIRKKAEADFTDVKNAKLAEIREEGTKLSNKVTALQAEVDACEKRGQECNQALYAVSCDVEKLEAELAEIKMEIPDECSAISGQIQLLKTATEAPKQADDSELNKKLDDAKEAVKKAKEIDLRHTVNKECLSRIDELEARKAELSQQIVESEKMQILLDRFASERCEMLESNIDSKFTNIKWKLFNEQINGGLAETCCCLIPCNGSMVAYETANTASKLYADIEVVNVLSKHYDLRVPLFFDNRERVNVLPESDLQMITLAVTDDAELVVEKK